MDDRRPARSPDGAQGSGPTPPSLAGGEKQDLSERAEVDAAVEVAAVIVNYRTKELTAEAARSVASEPGVEEIVIVDNDSRDGSVDYLGTELTDPRVRVVTSPSNIGFGQGVNLGARQCVAPLLLILNSDAVLLPGSLAPMTRTLLEDDSVAIVAPAVYDAETGDLQAGAHGVFPSLKAILLRKNRRPPETLWPDWVSGVAFLLRRRDFEEVGGFDPEFRMYLEDVDLCRRFRSAGRTVRRDLAAGAVHIGNRSWTPESFTLALDQALRGRAVFYRKAGYSVAERMALEVVRRGHMLLQRTPFRRSFPKAR